MSEAVRVGDLTNHSMPIKGSGSPDVLIGGSIVNRRPSDSKDDAIDYLFACFSMDNGFALKIPKHLGGGARIGMVKGVRGSYKITASVTIDPSNSILTLDAIHLPSLSEVEIFQL